MAIHDEKTKANIIKDFEDGLFNLTNLSKKYKTYNSVTIKKGGH